MSEESIDVVHNKAKNPAIFRMSDDERLEILAKKERTITCSHTRLAGEPESLWHAREHRFNFFNYMKTKMLAERERSFFF